jgi:hypothetical protein
MNRIIYPTPEGGVAVIIPAESVEAALKDVPAGVDYEIVPEDAIPSDRFFRNAWKANGAAVEVDLPKAKAIGHDIRRTKRAQEFGPLDIEATIPAKAKQAEEARQVVRDKYAAMQVSIDAAESPQDIKACLI